MVLKEFPNLHTRCLRCSGDGIVMVPKIMLTDQRLGWSMHVRKCPECRGRGGFVGLHIPV